MERGVASLSRSAPSVLKKTRVSRPAGRAISCRINDFIGGNSHLRAAFADGDQSAMGHGGLVNDKGWCQIRGKSFGCYPSAERWHVTMRGTVTQPLVSVALRCGGRGREKQSGDN